MKKLLPPALCDWHSWQTPAFYQTHTGQHDQHLVSRLVGAWPRLWLIWGLWWYHRRILHGVSRWHYGRNTKLLTFCIIIRVYEKVKIGTVTETALIDDFALQFKDRDACAVKLNTRRLLLRLELEKHGGSHVEELSRRVLEKAE